MRKKQQEIKSRDEIYLVFLPSDDELLEGKGQAGVDQYRILAHERIPAFYAYYAGKKIADLDPHEILYAMAENRLMFVSEGDKELFVSILLEKLKDDEKLTRFMNILGNVAIGIAVATALIVAGVFAGKKALKANDGQ